MRLLAEAVEVAPPPLGRPRGTNRSRNLARVRRGAGDAGKEATGSGKYL